MKLAAIAGFAAGVAIVVWVFVRELSDGAEKLRLADQADEEAQWRAFLARWEEAA